MIKNKMKVLIWSFMNVFNVVLLNPNFSSKTNVSYNSNGRSIISSDINSKKMK